MRISRKTIEAILNDISPKVEAVTGWESNLDSLAVETIKARHVWDGILKQRFESLGIETEPKTLEGRFKKGIMKYLFSYMILGAYEDINSTLFINSDALGEGTNNSGLAVLLGHELMHHCQHLNKHYFIDSCNSLIQKLTPNIFDGPRVDYIASMLQSHMILIEGDASFVEDQLRKIYYQDAKLSYSFYTNLLLPVLRRIPEVRCKQQQYRVGKKLVSRIYGYGGRTAVCNLYDDFALLEIELHKTQKALNP